MKNSRQGFSNFLMIFFLLLLLLAILSRLFLTPELWYMVIAVVSVSGALYAISDLFKKGADDQKNMSIFSSRLITPLYEQFSERGLLVDAEGKDISKTSFRGSGEFERLLRISSDMRERTVLELLWEHRNVRTRQKSSRGNAVVSVLFLLLSLIVLIGSVVVYFWFPQWIPVLGANDFLAIVLCSLAIILASAFASGSVLHYLQQTELLLALKDRCDAILNPVRPLLSAPSAAPAAATVSVPTEASSAEPAPGPGGRRKKRHGSHNTASPVFVPASEPVSAASDIGSPAAETSVSDSEVSPDEGVAPDPYMTYASSASESAFVPSPASDVNASAEVYSAAEADPAPASPFVSESADSETADSAAE